MKNKKPQAPFTVPLDDFPEEFRELFTITAEDYERHQHPPRRLRPEQCRNMKDVVQLVSRLADLNSDCQVLKEHDIIVRWIWPGAEFSDRHADVAARAATHACDVGLIKEIRLVGTRVSQRGIRKLQQAFPHAKVTSISKKMELTNWRWTQAVYDGELD
ncbi:MAG: hypothetical protein HY299_04105 [Verrucomicrobia bacterium]|nr:hypothetical protein [Verrucomicrobiota bacterium]